MIFFYMLLVAYQLHETRTYTYNRQGHNIRKIPSDIPYNVTDLILLDNSISSTDPEDFLGMHLEVLQISKGILASFPNLTFVAGTLKVLNLGDNKLTLVEGNYLELLVNLQQLFLQGNQLKSFPDVTGPSSTLTSLYLGSNQFIEFPPLTRVGLNLEHLSLMYNNLTTMPPLVWKREKLTIRLDANPLVCDHRLIWLRGSHIEVSGTCDKPISKTSLQGLNFKDLLTDIGTACTGPTDCVFPFEYLGKTYQYCSTANADDYYWCALHPVYKVDSGEYQHCQCNFGESRNEISHEMLYQGENIYSLTMPVEVELGESVIQCALKCLNTQGCLYINYKPVSDINLLTICHIASPINGKWLPTNGTYSSLGWTYYTLK